MGNEAKVPANAMQDSYTGIDTPSTEGALQTEIFIRVLFGLGTTYQTRPLLQETTQESSEPQ